MTLRGTHSDLIYVITWTHAGRSMLTKNPRIKTTGHFCLVIMVFTVLCDTARETKVQEQAYLSYYV